MKKKTLFYCDLCGFGYASQAECKQCEEFHVKPAKLLAVGFQPQKKADIPYPGVVVLEMADGVAASYVFNSTSDYVKEGND